MYCKLELNSCSNFQCRLPSTKFHWTLLLTFRDETWTVTISPLCINFMHFVHIFHICWQCWAVVSGIPKFGLIHQLFAHKTTLTHPVAHDDMDSLISPTLLALSASRCSSNVICSLNYFSWFRVHEEFSRVHISN